MARTSNSYPAALLDYWPKHLAGQCKVLGLPAPEHEYRFHPDRRWRFDLAWPQQMIAVEIDGGGWTGGRHARGGGIERDCEKFCEAAILGWRLLRVTPRQVQDGIAVEWLRRALVMIVNRPGQRLSTKQRSIRDTDTPSY